MWNLWYGEDTKNIEAASQSKPSISQHSNKMKQSNIKKCIEVRENRDRGLKSQGVLFTEPQSLTVFLPEFFKTAQSPELKLRNFATNRPAEPPPLSAVPKTWKESSYGYHLIVQKQN